MRSREEFVKKFRNHLAGGFLYGAASDLKDGPVTKAARSIEILPEVEKLLAAMYEYVAEKNGVTNGAK